MMTKVFAKKIFGVKYEKIARNLIMSIVLYGGLSSAGIHLAVAPFIICLMLTTLTVGEMWHALAADDNSANIKQMFMMPFESKYFAFSYISCLGGYILLTRTLPLMAVIFAVAGISVRKVLMSFLCIISATLLASGIFVWKRGRIPALVWLGGMIVAFWFLRESFWLFVLLGLSIAAEVVLLSKVDAYAFYIEESGKKTFIKGRRKHYIGVYFLRYMAEHKNYLLNSLFLWAVAVVLPYTFLQFEGEASDLIRYTLPLGFAILSLNTPICILLSCDPELEKAVRALPGQLSAFFIPYWVFVFVCNLIADVVYLIAIRFWLGSLEGALIPMAVLFAAGSAGLSVLLECKFPIRGWKIENELWNHPRKYLVPCAMIVLAGLFGMLY